MFWEAESMAAIHIKRGRLRPGPAAVAAIAFGLVLLVPYLALLAAVRGRPRGRAVRTARRCCSLGFLVYYNLIHVVTHGFNRYRLPVMPVVFLFAVVGDRGLARRRRSRRCRPARQAAAAALAVTAVLCLVPSLRHVRHAAYGLAPAAEDEPPEEMPLP